MEAIGRFSVDWGNSMSHSTSPASAQSALAKYKLVTMNRRNVIDEELTLDRNGLRDRGEWNGGFAGVNVCILSVSGDAEGGRGREGSV